MIPYGEEYEARLSLLKLEELNIHLDILCLKYIAKVRDYDDHPCKKFLKDQDHYPIKQNITYGQPIFFINTLDCFVIVVFFSILCYAWSYLSLN